MIQRAKPAKIYELSKHLAPQFSVKSGDIVIFETEDAFGGQITDEHPNFECLDWDATNPLSGPVCVEGAEIGDTLKVEILTIDPAEVGLMCVSPGNGLFGAQNPEPSPKLMPVKNGYVLFSDDIRIKCNPMIGVIGVAPAGDPVPTSTPGPHGGNMDNKKIAAGSALYLPVGCPGALLGMGDVHAAMGDGEISITGVECAAEVTVRVSVVKGVCHPNPVLINDSRTYTIASDHSLEKATYAAAHDMLQIVMAKRGLGLKEAQMLLSACGDTEICQVVDPLVTARFSMPKEIVGDIF